MGMMLGRRKRDSQQHADRQKRSAPACNSQSRTDTFQRPESQRSTSPSMKSAQCPGNSPGASPPTRFNTPAAAQAVRRHPLPRPPTRTTQPTQDPPPPYRQQREPKAKPGAKGAGKAERSDRRAREDYGRGWAGRCNQATPPKQLKIRPHHTGSSASRRRSPARKRRQGGAQRPPREGGLREGVGGAV